MERKVGRILMLCAHVLIVFGLSHERKRIVVPESEHIEQLQIEVQSLKAAVQELTQYAAQGGHSGSTGSCNCQGEGGPTYIRWGRKDCPTNNTGADLVYTGMAAGGYFSHSGAPAEYVCLPMDPDDVIGHPHSSNKVTYIYGAEYEDNFFNNLLDADAPCAVCMPNQAKAVIMIPAKTRCYPGWTLQYSGTLASGLYTHQASTQYVCMDANPETFDATYTNLNGKLFYPVEAECGSLRCPPYKEHAFLPCVVCSK